MPTAAVITGGLPLSGFFVSVLHSGLLHKMAGRNSSKVLKKVGSSLGGCSLGVCRLMEGTWPLSTKLTSLVDLGGPTGTPQEGNRIGVSRIGNLC